jgi:uncharacterized heparinase superfamily protein
MELVERLAAEGRVRLAELDDDEVAEWRRVVDYAKRHVHPAVALLREDKERLVMPPVLCRRSR